LRELTLAFERLVPEPVAVAGLEAGANDFLELVEAGIKRIRGAAVPVGDEATAGGEQLLLR
jgi:hypothetical protein